MACGSECNQEVGDAIVGAVTAFCQNNQAYTGDPVNVVTGAFFYSEQDVAIPSQRLAIVLNRHYNNQEHHVLPEARFQPFGPGWTFSFGIRLEPQQDDSVAFTDDRGSRLLFFRDPVTDGLTPPAGSLGMKLERLPDGHFHLRQVSGLTAEFDVAGRLEALAQPGPQRDSRIQFRYDDLRRLRAVLGVGNRGLEFTYAPGAFLISQTRDHSGRLWRYFYNDHGELKEVCDPAGRSRRYEYDGWNGQVSSERKTTVTKALRAMRSVFAFTSLAPSVAPVALVTNSYTTEQRVHLQTDALGNQTRFEYNPFARTTAVTDPGGYSTLYCFDEAGSTTKVRSPGGGTTEYVFDDRRNLLAEIDPLGRATEYVDFKDARILETHLGFGRRALGNRSGYLSLKAADLTRGYDGDGNRPLIRDPAGNTTRFDNYTPFGQPRLTTLPNESTIHTTFDDRSGLPLRRTSDLTAGRMVPLRSIEQWKYDDIGNCLHHRVWAEDIDGRLSTPVQIEEFDYESEFHQLTAHRKWTEHEGKGASFASEVRYQWDSLGRIIEEASFRRTSSGGPSEPSIKQFSYDALGRKISEIQPDGSAVIMEYDMEGNLTESFLVLTPARDNLSQVPVDRRLNRCRVTYDCVGRPVQLTDASGAVTTRTWDECGRCATIIDPCGVATTFQYDRDGRLIEKSAESGQTTGFDYDQTGRETRRHSSLGFERYTFRDVLGRPVRVSPSSDDDGGGIKYEYDEVGHVKQLTFPDDTYELLDYDEFDNLVRRQRGRCGHAPVAVEVRCYDGLGRLHSVESGEPQALREQVSYLYLDADREVRSFDALGNVTRSQYDTDGRLLRRWDAEGRLLEFTYDLMGRLVRRWASDGSVESRWTYEYGNLLSSATESEVSHDWVYNSAGKVLKHRQTVLGDSRTIQYEYDALGRLFKKYFDDRWWVGFKHASSLLPNRLLLPGNEVALEYDLAGRIQGEHWGNGGRTSFEYSLGGSLKSLQCTDAADEPIWEQQFERDRRQRPTSELRRSPSGSLSYRYQYDVLNRLKERESTRAGISEGAYVFDYDAYDNRTGERHFDAVIASYTHDLANRIVSAQRASVSAQYQYDRSGLLISDGSHRFEYDAAHRLRKVLSQGMRTLAEYWYSATGEVALVSRDTGLERRFYDGQREIVCESPAGRVDSFWSLRQDCLLATRGVEASPTRVYTDALGSVLGVARERCFAEYDAFGAAGTLPTDVGFGFESKRYEPSAGLYLNGARVYDPVDGRFAQPDPMGLVDGPHLYRYARNNPLVYGDSTGFEARPLSQGRLTNLLLGLELSQFPGQTEGRSYIAQAGWLEATPLRAEPLYAKHYDANWNLLGRSYIVHPGFFEFETVPHIEHVDANWNLVGRTYIKGPGLFESLPHARHYDADWNTLGRSYLVRPGLFETSPHIERYDANWNLQQSTYVEGPGLFESRSHLQHYGTRGSVGRTDVVPPGSFETRSHFHHRV